MRRLALIALSPALLAACDDLPSSQIEADAQDASVISAPIIEREVARTPPVISAPERRRAPEPVVVTLADAKAARADALTLLNPMLGLVPGLASSVAEGALQPSDTLALPAGVAALTGAPWLLVDGKLVLAVDGEVAPEWMTGAAKLVQTPKSVEDGLDFVASKTLVQSHLPSAMRTLIGATVKVYDHEHEVCVARIAGMEIEARFQHSSEWTDEGTQVLPKHSAAEVFEQGVVSLRARLDPVSGAASDCAKGVWAEPVDAQRPVLFRAAAMDNALVRDAVRAYRQLPAYAIAQHDFANFYADDENGKGRWDSVVKHELRRYVSDDGARELLLVHADTWDGCGSNGQKLTALFDVVRPSKNGGKTTLVPLGARFWDELPVGLVDLDADGRVELMDAHSIYRWRPLPTPSADGTWFDNGPETLESFDVPSLDDRGCGC